MVSANPPVIEVKDLKKHSCSFRDLLNEAVGFILHLERGKLTLYQGNYDSFERQRREKQALTVKLKKKQEDQRKHMMAERADAFVALPGGIGTLEELFEVWTWRQLGYHDKPVGLLNAFGFYDHLIAFNRHMIETGFVRPAHATPEVDLVAEVEHVAEGVDVCGRDAHGHGRGQIAGELLAAGSVLEADVRQPF